MRRFMPGKLVALCLAFLVAAAVAGPTSAQSVTDILKRGKIRVGVLVGAPPYGSVDARGESDRL